MCTCRILSRSFPHTVNHCPLILSLWLDIDLPECLNHIAGSSLTTLVYNAVIGTAVLCLHFCIDQLVLEHIVANSFYLAFIGGLNRIQFHYLLCQSNQTTLPIFTFPKRLYGENYFLLASLVYSRHFLHCSEAQDAVFGHTCVVAFSTKMI